MTAIGTSRRRRVLAASSPLLLLPAFFPLNAYLVAKGYRVAYSADLVHPYMVLQDFLRAIDTPWWWHHSPALYIYPDWLLVLGVMTIPVSPLAWPLLFAPLMLTLHSVAGGALLAVTGIARPVVAIWAVGAMLYAAGLAAIFLPGRYAAGDFTSVAAPYVHSGAALVTVAGAALLLYRLTGRGGIWHDAILCAGVFAAVFSDVFFIAWFVIPAGVLALAHAWSARARAGLWLAGVVLVPAAAAFALEVSIHGVWRLYAKARGDGIDSLSMVWDYVGFALAGDPLTVVVLAASVAMIAAAAPPFLRALGRRALSPVAMLAIFLGGSAAGAVLAPIAGNIMPTPHASRYFLVLGPLAAVGIAFGVVRLADGSVWRPRVPWIASAAIAAAAAALAWPAGRAVPSLVAPPALQTCLEALGRKAGIGDYWSAKSLMFASRRKIHMVQILPWMDLFRWNFNERWFTHRADDDTTFDADFILPARLHPHNLVHRYDPPARVAHCAGSEVWVYDKPLKVMR